MAAPTPHTGRVKQWRISTDGDTETARFVGRLVTDAAGAHVLLEAIENGNATIHPVPLRKPGGRPVDARPDMKGGALTLPYLERLLKRRRGR